MPRFPSRNAPAVCANISTQFDPPWDAHARLLFAQLEAYGLLNPLVPSATRRGRLAGCPCQDDPCPHFETWRRSGQAGTKPRQNDYAFVTSDLMELVTSVEVLDIDHAFSEQGPIVLELDL